MASVDLDGVKKVYDNGFEALHGLDLRIADGEFMILVGPSGCGKTTALRMVAGLEGISAGEIRIGGEVVNDVAPRDRDIAMVFQNYALYPHMTVAQNIAFALKVAKAPKAEIERRVREVAEVLGLSEWLGRRPGQLSGGQRQRVAMGRAIIRQPSVFLMDEPLSNLDAKLRVQMRAEVSRIQHDIGVSTIYVTHDQVEAMTMGDRVAVLNNGSLQQCASPQDLYDHPDNLFVAAFIGSPSMNLYGATLDESASTLKLGSQTLQIPEETHAEVRQLRTYQGRRIVVGLRPEHLSLAAREVSGSVLRAEVHLVEALGSELLVHFTIDTPVVIPGGASIEEEEGLSASGASVARLHARSKVRPGDRVELVPDMHEIRYFDPETERAIR